MQAFWGKKWVGWTMMLLFFAGFDKVKSQVSAAAYRMRALTVNNGLPQGWITDIKQDGKGFIWMVASGLARYDGRTFQRYQHRSNDSGTLLKNDILSIQPDDAGDLWTIYNVPDNPVFIKPVDVFSVATGKLRHISAEKGFGWMAQLPNIGFVVQRSGSYFTGNYQQLIRFNPATGNHQPILLPAGEELLSLGEDAHRQVWANTTGHLCRLSGNTLVPVVTIPVFPNADRKTASVMLGGRTHAEQLFEDAAGNIVTLALDGVFIYQPATGRSRFLPLPLTGQLPVGLTKDKDGRFFFLLAGNLWQLSSNTFESVPAERVSGENFIEPLLADRAGTIWAIKKDATGLRLFDFHPANFRSYAYKNGFSHDVLEPWLHNPISWQDDGSYGTRFAKDTAGNIRILNYRLNRDFVDSGESSAIYQLTATGAVLIAGNGLKPMQLAFDKYNRFWVVHLDKKYHYIDKADPANGSYENFAQYPVNTDNQYNGYLTCAGNKVCAIEGPRLRIYDMVSKACTIYTNLQLGFEQVMLIAVADPNDEKYLWISSQGSGITKLDLQNGKTEHFTEADGLLNNTVYMMVPDKKGFFWCSSNKGLFRFNPRNYSVVSFSVEDGLPGNEFNRFHFIETPDGHFIFGGTEGYTIFHPDSVYIDNYNPQAVISGILINNQLLASVLPSLQDNTISSINKLELRHNQNFISFSFSALQFINPQKTRYRYQLEGIDKDWVIAGPEAGAGYTFLPPGHYIFKVNASNTDGIWSNQVKTLEITVLPPWWKTDWAYLLYLLLAMTIVYTAYKIWLRRTATRQKLQLQQKEAEQLRAMDEMKNRFFSNITHEFRTPLTLITAPLEEIQRTDLPAGLQPKLQGVQRNAEQLLHLINQLLDMAKLEANSMPVHLQRGNLPLFVKTICDSFQPRAASKHLTLNFETNIAGEEEHLFDSDKVQKIIANLLSNAIKSTPAEGSISCQLSVGRLSVGRNTVIYSSRFQLGVAGYKDSSYTRNPRLTPGAIDDDITHFQIRVSDTGIGIPPEKFPFIFNRFYQVDDGRSRVYEGTGIGLALVKELTELMNGTISVTGDASGSGTTFLLSLPLMVAKGTETVVEQVVKPTSDYTEQPEIVSAKGETTPGKPLLLVTEDNPELRAFIANSLGNDYRVMMAENGKQGLEKAGEELPDIIISDARMPEMDGFEFCKAIKQTPETSHIAFILLTAKATQQSRIEGLQSQADDYLTKPFHVEELRLRIRNMLQRQQQLRLFYNRQLTAPETALPAPEQEDPFLQRLYNYLEKNLDEPDLTVEKLATAAGMSQRTLTRKLQMVAGISGLEMIKQYRLKKAAGLLLVGSTVSEAAFATGYDNPNYFSTAFKNFYEVAPTEYVKKYSGKQ